jgi:hypothetical protein
MKGVAGAFRVLALVVFLLVCHVVGARAAGFATTRGSTATGESSGAPAVTKEARAAAEARLFLLTLAVCALETGVVAYPVLRSRWRGGRLAGTVFLLFFGVVTVQPMIEAAYFEVVSPRFLGRMAVMGGVIAALFAPVAVLFLGRWKAPPSNAEVPVEPTNAPPRTAAGWMRKAATAVVLYVVLYFVFGYLVAWQSDAVREFYGGSESASALHHLSRVLRGEPWLLPLQALRALLWVALALPVIALMRGRRWERSLALGLLFAVLMNAQLLLPNAAMPAAVRHVHLLETAACNLLFGAWIGASFGRSASLAPERGGRRP